MRRLLPFLLAFLLMGLATRLLPATQGGAAFAPPATVPPFGASWTRSGSNPILQATVGWETTAVQENVVTYEAGTWKMWYRGGWTTLGVGYATSTNGLTWTKYASNPVYGRGGSGMAGNDGGQPFVFKNGSTYWLYATNNDIPRMNVATSSDGIAWTTQTSSISLPDANSTLWGNRVVWIESGSWFMLQEVFRSLGSFWLIYLYTSSDGLTWTIGNGGASLSTLQVAGSSSFSGPRFARNSSGDITPKFGSLYHLWYHAAPSPAGLPTDIYHATSPDKITWTISPATPVLTHTGSGFEVDQVAGPNVITVGGTSYLFYDGDDNPGATGTILLATAPASH